MILFLPEILPVLKNRQEAKEALQTSCQLSRVPLPLTRGLVLWGTRQGCTQHFGPSSRIAYPGNYVSSTSHPNCFNFTSASLHFTSSNYFRIESNLLQVTIYAHKKSSTKKALGREQCRRQLSSRLLFRRPYCHL